MKEIVCSGALFYTTETQRYLFLHRAQGKHKDVWGLVGGLNEETESPWTGLQREIEEEVGNVDIKKTIPLETFVSNDSKFLFHTYLCVVAVEFIPKLNYEHNGYAWVSSPNWPKPLHHGLRNTLNNKINQVKLDTISKLINIIT